MNEKHIPDEEPITANEVRQARAWRARWNGVKYPLMALTKLFKQVVIWILGLGLSVSAIKDMWK